MRLLHQVVLICLLSATALSFFPSTHAATIRVGPADGFSKIQDAVDAASPGDIILVNNGTYRESVHVTKQIVLMGIGDPVVDAMGNDNAILISANRTMLQGFHFTNSSERGIKIASDDNIITDNHISDNDYAGIVLIKSYDNVITGNVLTMNGYYGVYLADSERNKIKGNFVNDSSNSGLELIRASKNDISDNVVVENKNDGIELKSSENNTIKGNTVTGNKDGVCLEDHSKNNIIIYNNASGNSIDGILLKTSEFNSLLSNYVRQNPKGIFLETSSNNLIRDNRVRDNLVGVHLNYYSRDNAIYRNDLVNNTDYNAYDESGSNQWNIGHVGNHYGDYDRGSNGCIDSDYDKICDKGHSIPGGSSFDNYSMRS
jgi:nitrous oxidase accessory protein